MNSWRVAYLVRKRNTSNAPHVVVTRVKADNRKQAVYRAKLRLSIEGYDTLRPIYAKRKED